MNPLDFYSGGSVKQPQPVPVTTGQGARHKLWFRADDQLYDALHQMAQSGEPLSKERTDEIGRLNGILRGAAPEDKTPFREQVDHAVVHAKIFYSNYLHLKDGVLRL